ncbi:succinyl-coa:3-ketoacid-coenzyme a transferase-like protein, partial [Trypanosoma theileri]
QHGIEMLRRSFICKKAKIMSSVDALRDIGDGASVAVGGFGLCGVPFKLLSRLRKEGRKNLHIISTATGGEDSIGLGPLLRDGQVKTLTTSYIGLDSFLAKQLTQGKLRLELSPMGTLVERLRCGGSGIPAFYTPTGFGTDLADGNIPVLFAPDGSGRVIERSEPRETREVSGRWCVLEHAIEADFSLIKAWKADTRGNLLFRGTTQNMNAIMATCAKTCIAEVEEIVEVGKLDASEVHVPFLYVDRIVLSEKAEKHSNPSSIHDDEASASSNIEKKQERIARRAVLELGNDMCVKLGVGTPSLVKRFLPENVKVFALSESGMIWSETLPKNKKVSDPDFVNAGGEAVVIPDPGASLFDSVVSLSMLRGGHVDATMLGAFQVSSTGDIASWYAAGKLNELAGAMGVVSSGGRIIALTEHVNEDGTPRIVEHCNMPLTGKGVVQTIITDLAVFDVVCKGGNARQLLLKEIAEGVTIDELKAKTGAFFLISDELMKMRQI